MENINKSIDKTVPKKEELKNEEIVKTQDIIAEQTKEVEVKETKIQPEVKTKIVSRRKLKIDDGVNISVKSNVAGTLIYINHKTGDETRWSDCGDVQTLKIGDIRAMKAKQTTFLSENWITIVGIEDADEGFEDVEVKELLDALGIINYYKNNYQFDNINEVFNWSEEEMKSKIPNMSKSLRETLLVNANDLIEQGILDSMKKIRTLEEILGCELAVRDNY